MRELAQKIAGHLEARPFLVDAALAALLVGIELFYVLYELGLHDCPCEVGLPGAVALSLATTLPLVWRRHFPFAVMAVVGSATFMASVFEVPALNFGALVALFTVASLSPPAKRVVTLVILVIALAVNPIVEGDYEAIPEDAVMYGAAWVLGALARTRRAYTEELETKAARLEREREERARLAVAEERGAIARELHDVVAHGVTAMVIQADAALSVMSTHPERAEEAMRNVEGLGRKNLEELRRMLGILRADDDLELAPQAGLARLPELLQDFRSSGLNVVLEQSGDPVDLPASVDLSAYRIIQESLTNALRHSSVKRANVYLEWEADELRIKIVNPMDSRPSWNGTGHGIPGMRERAALVGGSLEVTPREDAVEVDARLPLEHP